MTPGKLLARLRQHADTLERWVRTSLTHFKSILGFNVLKGVVIPEKCLCAAIGKGHVTVVCGTQFLSRPRVVGFRRFRFEEGRYPRPEELASAIRSARDAFRARDAVIVLSVPRSWVLTTVVELPPVVKENLASVIAYELDRFTPFTPTEAMYDFAIASEDAEKLKIAIVAMRSGTAKPYLDALMAHGVSPVRITTEMTAFGTLCVILGNARGMVLCITVDEEGYDGCLMKDGVFLAGSSGRLAGTDREEDIGEIRAGLSPLLAGFETEGLPPNVFLEASGRYARLDEELGVPVKTIGREDVRRFFRADIEDGVAGPLGGLVETIWPGAKGFNLAKKRLEERCRGLTTPVTWVLIALIAAAAVLYLVVPLHMEKARLNRIEYQVKIRRGEIRAIEALRQEIASIEADIKRIREFKESTPMALDVMKELTTILPKSVWLTRLRITGETVETEGYAGSATEMLPKLEQSGLFKKVEFSSPTIRDTRQNADRFVIKMQMEGFEEKKAGGPKDERKK
ncbi:MAG: Fimbrial assembly protein (PilN) [Syntrophorhabdus sp. PtaB.Bin184]|jgi:Tfp pilus assembly protein PilN|nr:MAG: Fimbrial assembly protein (PilN) [Syntrophorhabdus sp. PtaB.Bin184]